jgi:tetratricopeptide (TPR) repeat protein
MNTTNSHPLSLLMGLMLSVLATAFILVLPASAADEEKSPTHCIPVGTLVASPNQPAAPNNQLYGVAALGPSDAWAVGYYLSGSIYREEALIQHWDGTSWSIVPGANVGAYGNFLVDVTALTSTDIWAVGQRCPEASTCYTLVQHWDGVSWSVIPSPNQGLETNELSSVVAVSANDIWAVGSYMTYIQSADVAQTLILHWNGISWSIVPSPNPSNLNSILEGVTAVAPNDVWAVGSYAFGVGNPDIFTLAMHWDGVSWSIVPSASLGSNSSLSAAIAIADNDIWAVGRYQSGSQTHTLIEHWNGTSWTVVPSPNPGGYRNYLFDVAAVSADNVWAVGIYRTDAGSSNRTLVEHWDGTSWVVAHSPNPTLEHNYLYGVAALPTDDVWAVGSFAVDGEPSQTLVERYASCTIEPAPCPGEQFTDVCPTDYFYQHVLMLTDDAILSGYNSSPPCPNSTWIPCFGPYGNSTRGQIAKVVALAAGFNEPVSGQSFEDVLPGHTFYEYIERMAGRGIVTGYPCGGPGEPCGPENLQYFRAGNSVTRGQLSKMVVIAFGWSEPVLGQQFEDVLPGSTFYEYIGQLAGRGTINGYPCGGPSEPCLPPGNLPYFRTGNSVTRGQTAKIVQLARTEPSATPAATASLILLAAGDASIGSVGAAANLHQITLSEAEPSPTATTTTAPTPSPTATATATPLSCTAADALHAAGLNDQALAEYTRLLGKDPEFECALVGVQKSTRELGEAERYYQAGQAYERAKQTKLALDAYIEALTHNRGMPKVVEAINGLLNPVTTVKGDQFESVRAFAGIGQYDAALERLKKVIEENPDLPLPPDIQQLLGTDKFDSVRSLANLGQYDAALERLKKVIEEKPDLPLPPDIQQQFGGEISGWRQLRNWGEPWVRTVREFALALLTAAAIIFVFCKFWSFWKASQTLRLHIEDFDKGASNFDAGKGLASMVQQRLQQFGDEPGVASMEVVYGPLEKFELPAEVGTGLPQLKIIGILLDWLKPARVLNLRGSLLKSGTHSGAGLVLSLERASNGQILHSCTLWEKDFNPPVEPSNSTLPGSGTDPATTGASSGDGEKEVDPSVYYLLTEAAAVWTRFHLEKFSAENTNAPARS